MGHLKVNETEISGLITVQSSPIGDNRGSFARLYCERELSAVIGDRRIVQINHSRTGKKGTVRGLHFQRPPQGEMKLIRCLRGRVWDVALDLRKDSPTFKQWRAQELTPDNNMMYVLPEGFAHGFQALEDDCEMLYLHTAFYEPSAEGGFSYNDPAFGIDWPLPVTELSDRDKSYTPFDQSFGGL